MRRALAVVVAAGVLAACSGGGDDDAADGDETDDPTRTPRPEVEMPDTPDLPPFTEPGDGGAVVVADKGFSVYADSEGDPVLSWGVVLENTSEDVATYTDVKVEPVDAGGAAVPMGSGTGTRRVETLGVLLPGQRLGIGQSEPVHGTGVTDLRVEIGSSQWFPADARGVELATLTTSEVVLSGDTVDFAVDSGYTSARYARGGAVFRNAAGQIVGGVSRDDSRYDGEVAPGRTTGQIRLVDPVPDADPTKAEVYVDVSSAAVQDEAALLAEAAEVDDPDASEQRSSPDEFCALFGEYQLRNMTAAAGYQDPRYAVAPLIAIDPPAAIAEHWEPFYAWRTGVIPQIVLGLFDAVVSPSSEVQDHLLEVIHHWQDDCVDQRGYELPQSPFDMSDEPDELPPFAEPETGEIQVVEKGWSPTSDSSGSPQLTYGVIVENTTDQVATNVTVTVQAVGAPMPEYGGDHTIPVLLPGQRFGLGETLYTDPVAMTDLEVTVGDAQSWWPADGELVSWGEVTTSGVTVTRSPAGPYTVTFVMDSTYPLVRSRSRFHVIFRNASGQIVGGAGDELFGDITPGRSFGEVYSNYPVPDVTDTATEVYV